MAKKNRDQDVVHEWVKKSWWDGTITAGCGMKVKPGNANTVGWLSSITCPGCIAAGGRR